MEAILIPQGCDNTLKGEANRLAFMSQKEKIDMINKVRSLIIMCIGDKALREVARENTIALIWVKLKSFYMIKSLAHRLYLEQQL